MSEKTEGLDACEAENYRRSHEGYVQPDGARAELRARVGDMDAGRNTVEHDLIEVEKKAV